MARTSPPNPTNALLTRLQQGRFTVAYYDSPYDDARDERMGTGIAGALALAGAMMKQYPTKSGASIDIRSVDDELYPDERVYPQNLVVRFQVSDEYDHWVVHNLCEYYWV